MTRKNRLHPMLAILALLLARLLRMPQPRRVRNVLPLRDGGAGLPNPSRPQRGPTPYRLRDNEEYAADFAGDEEKVKRGEALKHALETRKFEIELYWKRAAYFWTFIAAALAAYGVIQASKEMLPQDKAHLSVLVTVLGFVFSFAWYAVNRGSKQWQENWENHVALLEDDVTGPLFKTISDRPSAKGGGKKIVQLFIGPYGFSVSKINQFVSLFVMVIWLLLLLREVISLASMISVPRLTNWLSSIKAEWLGAIGAEWSSVIQITWFPAAVIILGAFACFAMLVWGRSDSHDHEFTMTRYSSRIVEGDKTRRKR